MSTKTNGHRRPAKSGSKRIADELNELVSIHVARCTQDALRLLERRGFLAHGVGEMLDIDDGKAFEPDDTCDAIPASLRGVLAAANQPDAPSMSEAEARSRVAGNRLRAALERRKLSQADLARLLGKSPAFVSRVLQNPEKCRITTLRRFADALGADLADILASPI
ncbi:MAG: helix-turn-helix transcriptional regulator [Phycisphaerales bacterium]|nr:helix-turn-helix transcriptional regulator [Phycisphaerales bacterium]